MISGVAAGVDKKDVVIVAEIWSKSWKFLPIQAFPRFL